MQAQLLHSSITATCAWQSVMTIRYCLQQLTQWECFILLIHMHGVHNNTEQQHEQAMPFQHHGNLPVCACLVVVCVWCTVCLSVLLSVGPPNSNSHNHSSGDSAYPKQHWPTAMGHEQYSQQCKPCPLLHMFALHLSPVHDKCGCKEGKAHVWWMLDDNVKMQEMNCSCAYMPAVEFVWMTQWSTIVVVVIVR